jgi:hypothetical protein
MAETADTIIPLLREMSAENATRHREGLGPLELVERRLKALGEAQVPFEQVFTADSLLSTLVTGSSSSPSKRLSARCESWSV